VVAGVTIAAAAPGHGRHGEGGRTRKLGGLIMLRLRRGSPNASPNEFLPPPLSPSAAVSNPTQWNKKNRKCL
jgi:hypothetical protein